MDNFLYADETYAIHGAIFEVYKRQFPVASSQLLVAH
jgi:hypothetical protein